MNTKEIAQAVAKDERSVRRWARKAADKVTAIADKMTASSSTHPADFDFEETIAIIEAGMGKNAAYMFRQNAFPKDKGSPSPNGKVGYVTKMDIVEIISAIMAQVVPMITSQVTAQIGATARPQIEYRPEYFSILAFSNQNGIKMGMADMRAMGVECARISREKDIPVRKLPDERFGSVNAYHIEVLKDVFAL